MLAKEDFILSMEWDQPDTKLQVLGSRHDNFTIEDLLRDAMRLE